MLRNMLVGSDNTIGVEAMTPEQFWKNFNLGEEVSIAGSFIYNGLRRFHEMQQLEHTDEIFEVFYNLSVGIERLLKVAIVLLEHDPSLDVEALEKSLITHTHLELLRRVKPHSDVNLSPVHNEFLALLSTFYKSHRYNRFLASSVYERDKEKKALLRFLSKHLDVEFEDSSMFGISNTPRFKKFIRKVVTTITEKLYTIISDAARNQNLYTYEVRHDSRAESVFLGKADFAAEDLAWKELIVYLVNTKDKCGILEHIRSISELDFDPVMVQDYLEDFKTATMSSDVSDFVETAYWDIEGGERKNREEMLGVIADPHIHFNDEDE